MSLLPLRRRHPASGAASRPASRMDDLPAAEPAAAGREDDDAAFCGWFESSAALRRGLDVTELAPADAVAPQVPLGWWLHWQRTAAAGE